jgi:hypothetical protein
LPRDSQVAEDVEAATTEPLINDAAVAKVKECVGHAVAIGAKVEQASAPAPNESRAMASPAAAIDKNGALLTGRMAAKLSTPARAGALAVSGDEGGRG